MSRNSEIAKSLPGSIDSTPVRPSSGGRVSASSAPMDKPLGSVGSRLSDAPETPRSQSDLKRMAASEFLGAIWQGPQVIDSFCPTSKETLAVTKSVMKSMAEARLLSDENDLHTRPYKKPSKAPTTEWANAWPTDKGEVESNGPLISLMEEICQAVTSHSKNVARYFGQVTFRDYHDLTTLDATGATHALKPDGGLFWTAIAMEATREAKGDPSKARFFWREFLVTVELKERDGELIEQAFTYARAMFLSVERRWFALVITYNHKTTEARFTFWTRWAMYATTPYTLKERDGFQGFINAMVRMLLWKDAEAAGLLPDRNNDGLWVAKFGLLEFIGILSYRACARGRASRVYLAQDLFKPKPPLDLAMKGLTIAPGPQDAVPRAIPGKRSKITPHALRRSARLASNQQSVKSVEPARSRLAESKSSSPIASKPKSKPAQQTQTRSKGTPAITLPSSSEALTVDGGGFGMEELLGVFRGLNDSPEKAISLVSEKDMDAWQSLEKAKVEQYVVKDAWVGTNYDEPQVFADTHLGATDGAFGVAAVAKSFTKNPAVSVIDGVEPWHILNKADSTVQIQEKRLYQTLIYKTIGNSLTEADGPRQLVTAVLHAMIGHFNMLDKGWLHCDVSIGNIILVPKGEKRDPSRWLPGVTNCIGFMIDADLAVKWQDFNRTKASSKSGTPPFMSDRLLRLINNPRPGQPSIHLFTDDLNGFAWVLIWAAVVVGLQEEDSMASDWLKMLNVDSYRQVMAAKALIRDHLRSDPDSVPYTVKPIRKLLVSIFESLTESGRSVNALFIQLSKKGIDDTARTSALEKLLKLRDKTYHDVVELLREKIDGAELPASWKEIPRDEVQDDETFEG